MYSCIHICTHIYVTHFHLYLLVYHMLNTLIDHNTFNSTQPIEFILLFCLSMFVATSLTVRSLACIHFHKWLDLTKCPGCNQSRVSATASCPHLTEALSDPSEVIYTQTLKHEAVSLIVPAANIEIQCVHEAFESQRLGLYITS